VGLGRPSLLALQGCYTPGDTAMVSGLYPLSYITHYPPTLATTLLLYPPTLPTVLLLYPPTLSSYSILHPLSSMVSL
jgi:hypothetical protein